MKPDNLASSLRRLMRPPAVIHRRFVGGPYAGQEYRQTAGQGGNTAVFEARGMRGRYHSGEWEPIERVAPDLARN